MEESTKKILKELIDDYGFGILEDPDRLSQFLEDLSPENKKENFQLTFALGYLLKSGWSPSAKTGDFGQEKYVPMLRLNLGFSQEDSERVMEIICYAASLKDDSEPEEALSVFAAMPGNLKKISGGISNKPRTMWIRKKSLYNGLILIASLIAIAVLFFQIGSQRNPEGDEFRIAFLAPLECVSAQSSHNQLRPAQLAGEMINKKRGVRGYKLKIVGFSTPGNPAAASEYVRSVMKDKSILVMMTCMDAATVEAITPVADETEVPLIVTTPKIHTSTISEGDKARLYTFRIANDSAARSKMAAYFTMQGLNKKKIGIFYNLDDPYTVQEHEALVRWVKIFGGEIKADIGYSKKLSTAYTAAMTAIAESGAEALILPNTEEKTADIVKSARESGFGGTIIGEDYLDNPVGAATNTFRNSWWIDEISPLDPQIRSVLKEYRSLYNENLPQEDVKASILAFDGVRWIANCLATAPGYRGEAMRHALLATRNFPLTHATLTIDPRTHGPYNKAMSLIYCETNGGIFQKRIRTVKTEW